MNIEALLEGLEQAIEESKTTGKLDTPPNEILTDFETAKPLLMEAFEKFSIKKFQAGDVVTQHSTMTPYKRPQRTEMAIVLEVYERELIDSKGKVHSIYEDVMVATELRDPNKPPFWMHQSLDSRFLELVKPASEVFPDGLPNGIISSDLKESTDR